MDLPDFITNIESKKNIIVPQQSPSTKQRAVQYK